MPSAARYAIATAVGACLWVAAVLLSLMSWAVASDDAWHDNGRGHLTSLVRASIGASVVLGIATVALAGRWIALRRRLAAHAPPQPRSSRR